MILLLFNLGAHALRVFMDDEDDFAMFTENLFTDLDVDDRSSAKMIFKMLLFLWESDGVPPFSGNML